MKKLTLEELDVMKRFTRQHFDNLVSFSVLRIEPNLPNYTSWFISEIYPFLKSGNIYPIICEKEFAGYIILDDSINNKYQLKEKIVFFRAIYVAKKYRGKLGIVKTIFKVVDMLKDQGYQKILIETGASNMNVQNIVKFYKGVHVGSTFEVNIG